MELFSPEGHEQVVLAQDPASGLRAVIAVWSTALGPALGGTRFAAYPDEADALADALRLSRAMGYKNALAGLDAGGGKAVILGNPAVLRSDALLEAYGRAVAALGGRYLTACDVGTTVADMDVVARTNPWTTGRSRDRGGAGDSGELTALGVLLGMRAAAQHIWGEPTLGGRRVAVAGLGKVGHRLAAALLAEGASVVAADTDPTALQRLRETCPGAVLVAPEEIAEVEADVFSPNALGGVLTPAVVDRLRARVVCGGANNQLAGPDVADALAARGVLWCPDFLVNAGGVIAVADEGLTPPYDHARAIDRVQGIGASTLRVLELAAAAGRTPVAVAEELAERRIAGVLGAGTSL